MILVLLETHPEIGLMDHNVVPVLIVRGLFSTTATFPPIAHRIPTSPHSYLGSEAAGT